VVVTVHRVRARGGAIALMAAAAGMGSVSVLVKLAYQAGARPGSLLAARVGVSAVLLALAAAAGPARSPVRPPELALGAAGGAAFACAGLLEFHALSRAPAALVVVLVFVAPVWVTAVSWLVWRTVPGWRRAGLVGLVLAGTALLVATPGGPRVDGTAVAMALAASMLSAAFFVAMADLARRLGARHAACLLGTSAAATAFVAPGATLSELESPPRIWLALSIGALTAASLLLLCAGLARTGAVSGSAIAGAEPAVAALLAWLVLGEDLTGLQLVGALTVVTGVLQIARLASTAPLVEPHRGDEDDPNHDVLPEPLNAPDQ
jgi:drug/metabolite transporter (DMT)-like permease